MIVFLGENIKKENRNIIFPKRSYIKYPIYLLGGEMGLRSNYKDF